jgi:hypothetical protein
VYEGLKGSDGVDEALVPMDIETMCDGEYGKYLRDIEIASLLKKMVDKKLVARVVIDSCHSGSARRVGL